MHKLFKKKRAFPNNWASLSQEQVLDNVQYLLKHLRKYCIGVLGADYVRIENIIIRRKKVQISRYIYDVYDINKRMFTVDGEVGHWISKLIYCCQHSEKEMGLKEKIKEQFEKQTLNIANKIGFRQRG